MHMFFLLHMYSANVYRLSIGLLSIKMTIKSSSWMGTPIWEIWRINPCTTTYISKKWTGVPHLSIQNHKVIKINTRPKASPLHANQSAGRRGPCHLYDDWSDRVPSESQRPIGTHMDVSPRLDSPDLTSWTRPIFRHDCSCHARKGLNDKSCRWEESGWVIS